MNCAPVLDVVAAGDPRGASATAAMASDPAEVAAIGRAVAEGLLAGGVLPVMKHMPGHGRAALDSHLDLPRVDGRRARRWRPTSRRSGRWPTCRWR